jgi:hypothetical protein
MMSLSAEHVPAAVADAVAERDAIQANLLELDGSFVRQVLDGATPTGRTRQRWGAASAGLAELRQTYLAYSAVVGRAAELARGSPARRDLPELIGLLAGSSVRLARASAPLASRDLADTGREDLTLAAAVARMRQKFTEVAEVTAALTALADAGRWRRLGTELDRAESELAAATSRARDTERAAVSALDRRDELRGLLSAYKAKAARLGAAEERTWRPATTGHATCCGPRPATWRWPRTR